MVGVSLPTVPFDLPFGRQWLDLSAELLIVFAAQGAGGKTRHTFKVPAAPGFRGLTLGLQVLSGVGAGLDMTNAEFPILR